MMIFDSFPSLEKAISFLDCLLVDEGLDSDEVVLCLNRETFDKHEVYPYEVTFPAVLVARCKEAKERHIEKLVERYEGEFSGT